jgi:DNA-binding NtrC family response regulator
MNILVVDDQRSARRVMLDLLSRLPDVTTREATSAEEAAQAVRDGPVDLAFVDLRLTEDARDRQGFDVARLLRERCGALTVIVTGLSDLAEMRAALRVGVFDYLLKEHLGKAELEALVTEARNRLSLEREVVTLRARQSPEALASLVGTSPPMDRLRDVVRRVALSDRPALVTGPSGSGKELVARALHALGPHPASPLLDLNCGALPEQLIESLLFGHERGAFTGADRRQEGLLSLVGDGTLFLDEVAELPLAQQPKLLRVLETGRFRPVGSADERTFRGRLVAATHADLDARVREGRFREDLFHRLAVLRVRVPPLAERPGDLPLLLASCAADLRFTTDALEWLAAQPWPGNVRQLRNLVDQVEVFVDERPVTRAALEGLLTLPAPTTRWVGEFVAAHHPGDKLALAERLLVAEALRRCDGNKSAAARLLGVHRKRVERAVDEPDQPVDEPGH